MILAAELTSIANLDHKLAIILAAAERVFEQPRALVLLLDEAAAVLRVAVAVGCEPAPIGEETPISPEVLTSTALELALPEAPPGWRRVAIVLRTRSRPVGVFALADPDPRPFDAEEQTWLAAAASHAAAAIAAAKRDRELDVATAELGRLKASLEEIVAARTMEMKKSQARVLESQKMAALVHLVAGITHEMNSPLGTMVSASQTIDRAVTKVRAVEAAPSPGVLGALTESSRAIADASQRIDSIVRRLKSFVRLDEAVKQEIGVETCLEDALALLRHRLDGISLVRDYSKTASIVCYPARLNEVFSTVLRNACDAVEGKGDAVIVVRTRAYRECVCVEIDDNGVGMSEDELSRVFEPGFTRRDGRVRMGLGLAIAHQVVGDHQGEIAFESQIGLGTKVSIELPIAPASPRA